MRALLAAIKHCHQHQIVHRDLKVARLLCRRTHMRIHLYVQLQAHMYAHTTTLVCVHTSMLTDPRAHALPPETKVGEHFVGDPACHG